VRLSPLGRRESARSCSPIKQCSGENQRGGGVSGGGSRRGGCVGGGEGGELELGCGRRIERSEASVVSRNRRAREGEQEREMGGGSTRFRMEEGKRKRERAPGAAVGSTDRGVGMAPSGVVRGGSVRSRRRRAGEQGRAAGRGAADRWGQVATR
jgi:hypothetical protein